jgi:hydrogenase maturation protein HypF
MILTDHLTRALTRRGLAVYTGQQLPVNDGGLSLGQAVCAAARMEE